MSDVTIPGEFWKGMSGKEFMEIADNGLSQRQIRRLWRMLDRTDSPPVSMKIMVDTESLIEFFESTRKPS